LTKKHLSLKWLPCLLLVSSLHAQKDGTGLLNIQQPAQPYLSQTLTAMQLLTPAQNQSTVVKESATPAAAAQLIAGLSMRALPAKLLLPELLTEIQPQQAQIDSRP